MDLATNRVAVCLNRKNPSPDAARKRLDTGRKAEEWFLKH